MSEASHMLDTHADPPAYELRRYHVTRITIAARYFLDDRQVFVKPNIAFEIMFDNSNTTDPTLYVVARYPEVGRTRLIFMIALQDDTL
jgi:hypothetical protein